MQTGNGEKKDENIAWIGGFSFKDICFTCSFVVTLMYILKYFYYLIRPKL